MVALVARLRWAGAHNYFLFGSHYIYLRYYKIVSDGASINAIK